MGRATLSLTVLLVMGAVVAGVVPPTPASARPADLLSLLADPDDPRSWEPGRPTGQAAKPNPTLIIVPARALALSLSDGRVEVRLIRTDRLIRVHRVPVPYQWIDHLTWWAYRLILKPAIKVLCWL